MQPNRINILSTRPLQPSLLREAKQLGIFTDIISFIETEPIQSVEVQQEIEQALIRSAIIVFTSINAVEAVATYLIDENPDWDIYCIGNSTRQLVKEYFGEPAIAGTASSAAALADIIVENNVSGEVIFFCGDQRRNELPSILEANNIVVTEIEVYHTIATPHKVDKHYNGILFFSPSAVESFFSKNKTDVQTVLFAIGDTTAGAIKKYSDSRVLISDEPGKENLVEKVIDYFVYNKR